MLHRRAAEAITLRAHANGLLDGHGDERAVIVLGDLNHEPLAATTRSCSDRPAQRSAHRDSTGPTAAIHAIPGEHVEELRAVCALLGVEWWGLGSAR